MIKRSFAAIVIALVASAGLVVQAQAPVARGTSGKSAAHVPRATDGHPDFQGSWTTETYTPFERPAEFKDREFFTEAEAEAYATALARAIPRPARYRRALRQLDLDDREGSEGDVDAADVDRDDAGRQDSAGQREGPEAGGGSRRRPARASGSTTRRRPAASRSAASTGRMRVRRCCRPATTTTCRSCSRPASS